MRPRTVSLVASSLTTRLTLGSSLYCSTELPRRTVPVRMQTSLVPHKFWWSNWASQTWASISITRQITGVIWCNVLEVQESIPPAYVAWRPVRQPVPTRFCSPTDCSKFGLWLRDALRCKDSLDRREIRIIEGNAKCRHLKKLTC